MGNIASTGASQIKPVWADEAMRLDPYKMPQQVSYGRAVDDISVTLDNKGAVMKRSLTCGLPLSIALPARAFVGVAARAYEHEDGTMTMTLELLHKDSDLSVPLCVSDDVEETACDWHSWARALGVPMVMIDAQGAQTIVKDAGILTEHTPQPRRRRISSLKHRPNFLRRRKTGVVGEVRKLEAREIIART
ncbi:DUF6101 family protein [Pseudahrensia aquimaris]|uniref:DUF6101 family protein n=1 Tax=Pseudahrensia aquimaris TaxID=744461 RepID=A0ABW3FEI8_9HYPH